MNTESVNDNLTCFLSGWFLSFVKWTCVGFFLYTFMFGPFPTDLYAGLCFIAMLCVNEYDEDDEDDEYEEYDEYEEDEED